MLWERAFSEGCTLLYLGSPAEALNKFRLAVEGIDRGDQLLIDQLSIPVDARGDLSLLYFLKVAEMYEREGLSEFVINICRDVIKTAPENDPNLLPVIMMLFKHCLKAERYDEAFGAIAMMNTNLNDQRNCLRQLIIQLHERNLLDVLNGYSFGSLEHEFLSIIESRARAVDLALENYYDFLYSFFVVRSNFRKAATYAYELAIRLRNEVGGVDSLRRQVNAWVACLHSLSLVRADYAWLVRPILKNAQVGESMGSSPKRDLDGEEKETGRSDNLHIVTKREIEREYIVVKGNLLVAEKRGACAGFLPANELVKMLLQANLFDFASNVSLIHEMPLTDVLNSVTSRCVQSEKLCSKACREACCEHWSWVNENRSFLSTSVDQRSDIFPLAFLKSYLEHLSNVVPAAPLFAAVTKRLLSLSQTLPTWLISEYKKIDLAELLRLLIEYDELSDAQHLICDYLDAILGVCPENFALKETLSVKNVASFWIPISSIDQLLQALEEKEATDKSFTEVKSELERKLDHYMNQIKIVGDSVYREKMRKK